MCCLDGKNIFSSFSKSINFVFTAVLHASAAKLCRVLVGSGNIGHTVV